MHISKIVTRHRGYDGRKDKEMTVLEKIEKERVEYESKVRKCLQTLRCDVREPMTVKFEDGTVKDGGFIIKDKFGYEAYIRVKVNLYIDVYDMDRSWLVCTIPYETDDYVSLFRLANVISQLCSII